MKNFTNNFKQFTSCLSARWLIMALMMLVGTSSAWGGVQFTNDYIFLDLSSSVSEWEKDGAVFQVALNEWDHCGNGWNDANETGHLSKKYDLIETSEGSHIYYANVSDDNKSRYGAYFYRCNPSDKSVWNTACIGYNNSSHNCFKVNGWTSSTSTYNLTDVYCISAPTFGEVEVGQSATSSGTYLYAGVSTIPEISNNSTEFQYVAGSSSITTNGSSTITVKFTPSSAGDKTGTLKFGSYLTTSLSGKGKVSCATCCTEYYVAGISNWDANADIMSCENNIWSKKFSGKSAGTYKFKVTDGTWNNSWNSFDNTKGNVTCKDDGSNDHNIQFTTNSKGDITISFDGSKAWVTFEESCTTVDEPIISITNPTKCGEEPVSAGKITINEYNPEKYNYTLKKDGTVKDIVYNDGYAITEAGSYTVTADLKSGTSCGAVTSDSKSASIEDKTPSIGIFEITGVTEICSETSTNLECTNVNDGTYLWNTGATTRSITTGNLTDDTNYSVTVTKVNGTCPATKTANITIIVNALPSAPALNVPEGKVCAGDLILDDYIADSEINTVNWYKNSGCNEPATNPNLEPSVEETFYAKSKDGNNCISSGYSELTLTSYALPPDFTVTVSDNKVCSGEDVTINIKGRENGVDYKLENEVIPAEGITVNPTKNTTYSVIASLSECQNMTNTEESQQITVNGTTITQSPEVVHPYEVVTFTAGEQATWALYTNPSSGSQLSDDDAKYSGKDTAYITKGESRTTTFKGEAANGYVIHATVGDCTASYTFNVVEDPDNCR